MTKQAIFSAFIALTVSTTAFADGTTTFDLDFSSGSSTTTVKGQDAPSSFGNYYNDVTASPSSAYSYTFSQGTLSTTVEAGVSKPRDNDGYPSSNKTFQGGDQGVYVGRFSGGLGVGWEINPGDLDDDKHTVDDNRGQDFLVLDFNQAVELTSMKFGYFGSWFYNKYRGWKRKTNYVDVDVFTRAFENDGFDDTFVGTYRIDSNTGEIEFDETIDGETFVVMPSAGTGEKVWFDGKKYKETYEYFKLHGVSGQTTGGGGGGVGEAVPTPSAAIAGLVMLGLVGARRRRNGK